MLGAVLYLEGVVKRDISAGQPPSRPGQPPHVLTGRLRQSITHDVRRDGSTFIGRVGTNVEYARHLELGTRKMAPRPYLRPALLRERKRLADILRGR